MKRTLIAVAVGMLLGLGSVARASDQCRPPEQVMIDTEARCFPAGGLAIDYFGEEGGKVACMQNKEVTRVCGPDGRVTRLRAFTLWYNKVKQYEASCNAKGGVFNYQDANFVEPTNESYCLQAQPEVGSNMFEEPLCNYRAMCPSTPVVCSFPCESRRKSVEQVENQSASRSPFFR